MNCYFVHGFNVRDDGARTIDKLAPYVETQGWNVKQFDYGWTGLFLTLVGNASRARTLAHLSQEGDSAIGHSNGCAIIHRATYDGAKFKRIVYINPALDVDARPAPGVQYCLVLHSPDDVAVWAARLLPFVLWGAMGRDGYKGTPDNRVVNVNLKSFFGGEERIGHSDGFDDERIAGLGALVALKLGAPVT